MRVTARLTAPALEPLTAVELNTYLGTSFTTTGSPSEAETKLGPVIKEARGLAERWSRRSLLAQTWRLSMEATNAAGLDRVISLSRGPVSAITQVGVLSPGGSVVAMTSTDYALRAGRDEVALKSGKVWPAVTGENLLVVDYATGVAAANLLDPEVVRMVKELAALLWRHRGDGFVQGEDSFLDNPDVAKLLAKFADFRADGFMLAG